MLGASSAHPSQAIALFSPFRTVVVAIVSVESQQTTFPLSFPICQKTAEAPCFSFDGEKMARQNGYTINRVHLAWRTRQLQGSLLYGREGRRVGVAWGTEKRGT